MNFIHRLFNLKKFDKRLLGQWEGLVDGEQIIMKFSRNGKMAYEVHTEDRIQIMNLTFTTTNDLIITNQPSYPKEEVTKYRIERDVLWLDYNGEMANFKKI